MFKSIFMFLFFVSSIFADNINWLNYDEALALAKKENKMVALMVTNEYCGYCKKMHRTTLSDDKVKATLEEFFVPAIVDTSKESIPVNYKISGTPTFLFLDTKEELIYRAVGFKTTDSFNKILTQVMMRRH
jgi:thioredoxin-related protein